MNRIDNTGPAAESHQIVAKAKLRNEPNRIPESENGKVHNEAKLHGLRATLGDENGRGCAVARGVGYCA
jgi:hypothetical protein